MLGQMQAISPISNPPADKGHGALPLRAESVPTQWRKVDKDEFKLALDRLQKIRDERPLKKSDFKREFSALKTIL